MARTPRRIISGKVYELCFRVRHGLPFPPSKTINSIIKGVMARTQRDSKVTICHYLWMSNHAHFILIVKDAEQCMKFYMELERKLTEAIKKLLKIEILNLWEGTPMLALLPDIDTIKARITYLYANPSEANLEDNIERYPGLSTWNEFKNSESALDSEHKTNVTWIRPRAMEALPSHSLTRKQDIFFSDKFEKGSKKSHILTIKPNAWMKCFNVRVESDVHTLNNDIKVKLVEREKLSRERRTKQASRVIGAHRLVEEPILKPHKPKKKSKKIFVICHDKNLRTACIKEHQDFLSERSEIYFLWRKGDFSSGWPPGSFRPPMPQLASAVDFAQDSFIL